jgi:myo-inositol 2-dehydrogenase / D-chiro-inositol 1-dehydrogenase
MAAAGLPLWFARENLDHQLRAAEEEKKPVQANDKIVVGLIGCGGQGNGIMGQARGDKRVQVVAVCDVDKARRDETAKKVGKECKAYEDFRELNDRKDVNAVLIGTVDHWHALIAIDAMRKGKDVYCEKPLTLTVEEAQAVAKVAKATKKIFQVGSQQRSDKNFRLACELARNGRVGKIKTIETWIGKNPVGGPFKKSDKPEGLNWDFWQGPTKKVDYVKQRCHYEFRWWYEYSGGKMTDWGAHHNDIAQWALGADGSGPVEVVSKGEKPSTDENSYNCHPTFEVTYTYKDGAKVICSSGENGVLIEGEDGKWIFVRRGGIYASDQLDKKPEPNKKHDWKNLPKSKLLDEPLGKDAVKLYVSNNHVKNWLDGIQKRQECVCNADVGHRSVVVCHVGVISLRLGGKKLKWDPAKEKFDDDAANKMLSRPYRGDWKLES